MQIETFLDVLLIEEIPVENETSTGLVGAGGQEIVRSQRAAKKPMTGKVISCDTKFPYNGQWVEMPYKIGDVVRTNEFGRNYIVLNPEDEFRPEAKKYYLIRYEDIEGRVHRSKDALHGTFECANCGDKIIGQHQCFSVGTHA